MTGLRQVAEALYTRTRNGTTVWTYGGTPEALAWDDSTMDVYTWESATSGKVHVAGIPWASHYVFAVTSPEGHVIANLTNEDFQWAKLLWLAASGHYDKVNGLIDSLLAEIESLDGGEVPEGKS